MTQLIGTLLASAAIGIAAWFGTNFLGKPLLALREARFGAFQIAERYSHVNMTASDDLRRAALKALHDAGNALLALDREASIGVRLWCWVRKYDLDLAARCLFGLAEGARGEYSIRPDQRRNTLNALYISLGAARRLSPAEVETAKREIEAARNS